MSEASDENFIFGADQLEDRPSQLSKLVSDIFEWEFEEEDLYHTTLNMSEYDELMRKKLGRRLGGKNKVFCILVCLGYAAIYREQFNDMESKYRRGVDLLDTGYFYNFIRRREMSEMPKRLEASFERFVEVKRVNVFIPRQLYGMTNGFASDLDIEFSSLLRALFTVGMISVKDVEGVSSVLESLPKVAYEKYSHWADEYKEIIRSFSESVVRKVKYIHDNYRNRDDIHDDYRKDLEEYVEEYC